MVPDIALRLQSMTRAMTEVVIPGIDPSQTLALEQAHLVVAYLALLSDQHDKTFQYEMAELRDARSLLEQLLACSKSSLRTNATLSSGKRWFSNSGPVASLSIPSQERLADLVREVKGAADALVQAAYEESNADIRAAVTSAVMNHAERQIARERVWARKAGFEVEPEKLPGFDQVLAEP
jgi:hypothetical protein